MSAPVLPSEAPFSPFADLAFGASPTRSATELPEPRAALEIWWQAVALGGTGHYAAARTALYRLRTATTDPVLLSLAASTEGSLRRQLGRHARAARDDGYAAALVLPRLPAGAAGGHPAAGATGGRGYHRAPDLLDAAADALTGLAADALGTGRLALARRLLDRCAALLAGAGWVTGPAANGAPAEQFGADNVDRSRALVRLHWVRAETALAGGQGQQALADAEVARDLAERGPSIRHQVKSRLLVAAATAVTGDTGRAAELAALVDHQCRESGLLPLRWACAMLRTGLPAPAADPVADTRAAALADATACRALITRRGGRFHDSGT
ncbi:hypothetical protein [Nocardia sp. CA-290969]|uniref:hypothetical protein n=1 Tax=Nocardia sp. CA-290969 TaxID=3239986 RepID=UPI003D8A85D7